MKRLLPFILCLVPVHALADEAQIRQTLGERYPAIKITSIQPSPVAGIYEVLAGGKLVYVDQTGDYLLMGPILDTRSKTNLTQKRLDDLRMVKFDSLPFDKAIPIVKGNGARKVAVFSDPDCPFCKRLEKELALLDNITVYVFLNPIASLHPEAPARSNEIWCSADRAKSWRDYMLEGKKPAASGKCDTPVNDILALAEKIGVEGTPALVFPNGKRVDGAISAAQIEELLQQGS
ncbi:MAG: DsbC family protein [Hydrogenophilaceae bacterium]|nr:DsbC family protein [Hydrogenophilaceae bacterium]